MDKPPPSDILNLTNSELTAWLTDRGIESYRTGQIFRWLYKRQQDRFANMTDIRKDIRQLLQKHYAINRLACQKIRTSQDGSRKYLFELGDGATIESVLIPEKNHFTLCVSSQVGCAQNCRFCMTAAGGFTRNLTTSEIVAQVRDLAWAPECRGRLTNIVMMGTGEPLANYSNLLRALEIITDNDCGLGFSTRRVTVSTAGLVPEIDKLGKESRVNLAVSLNAADDRTRSQLMPINRKYPLKMLLEACRRYPLKQRRMITFEYILIKGVNDTPADARRLSTILRPIRAKINLIPFNEHENSSYKRPSPAAMEAFQQILHNNRYTAIVRRSKGRDICAACGQLRSGHT